MRKRTAEADSAGLGGLAQLKDLARTRTFGTAALADEQRFDHQSRLVAAADQRQRQARLVLGKHARLVRGHAQLLGDLKAQGPAVAHLDLDRVALG